MLKKIAKICFPIGQEIAHATTKEEVEMPVTAHQLMHTSLFFNFLFFPLATQTFELLLAVTQR